ncbi:STAS domain-containing protein [Oceanobacillus kapialis]|uniref:STAS domain-containing protein n=1 Tax=Oceanobacillus kapialis TaxID=481353 RepID=UPI00384A8B74
MELAKYLPLAFFKINPNFEIMETSDKTSQQFLYGDSLLSVLDEGSHRKVLAYIQPEIPETELEVVMRTKEDPMAVFMLYVKWEKDIGFILCQKKGEQVDKVATQLQQLRTRLAETDFALLENKEALEEAMEQVNLLSAPFIALTTQVALIPLFGKLDENKLAAMESSILHRLYDSDYQLLLFDFTSIGEIEKEGLQKIIQFLDMIRLLGQEIIICGLNPDHATAIHQYTRFPAFITTSNLQNAIQQYVIKKIE